MRTSRKILKNMFSLSIAEIANKGIIFITTAYLARVILPEGFGIIGYASSFIVYFILISNLGLNTVGTREIAKTPEKINKYVNSIFTARVFLSIFSYIGLFIIVLFYDFTIEEKYVIWIAGINVIFNAINSDWVFQGIEKMEVAASRDRIRFIQKAL